MMCMHDACLIPISAQMIVLSLMLVMAASGTLLSQDVLDQLEAQLSDSCGSRCTDLLADLVPLISNVSNPTDSKSAAAQFSHFNDFMNKIISNGKVENSRILKQLSTLTESSFANVTTSATVGEVNPHEPESNATTTRPPPQPPRQPGVPCSTQAECDSLDYKVNRCAYIRQNALKAYVGANAAVSVMANLMTVLCGCIFVGPSKICALKSIPYTCGFPFNAYMGLYGVSMSLWAAVTMTSTVCSMGGPDLLSY